MKQCARRSDLTNRADFSRRHFLATGTAAGAALGLPVLSRAAAPTSTVALVRCRSYGQFTNCLSSGFNQIGGIEQLVRGKTVGKTEFDGQPKEISANSRSAVPHKP